ncbi:hypothetical protein [Pedobacter sp. MC2016-24]|uniref:hypothetical protein n=1 Tax=Pedobacter sp. MC2016-24 TaxID=2780090 RepID=UPI00187F939D|nr:hypothetical protein [Pedobacter sp. MC2016-24]MBE9601643.1 hypothetical protein [Pedobacter sp. MC2016-24]
MNLKTLMVMLFVSTIFSCKTGDREKVVLQLGRYKLTTAQLKVKIMSNKYKLLSNHELENKLIEEGRILAFAIEHRYDTIGKLNLLLNYASRAYVSREDGFVWNKKVKPLLQLTEKAIIDGYHKRAQVYTFEIIRLSDPSTAKKYQILKHDFDLLRKNAIVDKYATVFTMKLRYPFYPLCKYVKISDSLKAGDVVGSGETENGYIYSHVQSVKPFIQKAYQDEKADVRKELLFALTQKYILENQKQLFYKAKPMFYDRAIVALVSGFDVANKSWPSINPKLKLMEYTVSGKRLAYLASDFKEFVDNEPVFMGSLTNPSDVKKMLQSVIITQYLFALAKQLNVETDEDYLRFRKAYQENIFIEHFRRSHVFPNTVTPESKHLSLQNELKEQYPIENNGLKAYLSKLRK